MILDDSYYTLDVDVLTNVYNTWDPRITPFYAVKCNPTPVIIETLAKLGSNFDCASPSEIDLVLSHGVCPSRIIYANPCKRIEDILHAKNKKINLTTFDSICELKKMSTHFPKCKLLLRIRADDPTARCNLGVKYGAEEYEWNALLLRARLLELDIVGISFHVGSAARDANTFQRGIEKAESAIELAKKHGFLLRIIDIGGGFSQTLPLPKNLETKIPGVKLIAEPGRFFVEKCMTLHTLVIGRKPSSVTISESLYGGFNCILFDHYKPIIKNIKNKNKIINTSERVPMTLFGNTCDGGDIISKIIDIPKNIQYGDWIEWADMGAYTIAATTKFNGFDFTQRPIHIMQTQQ